MMLAYILSYNTWRKNPATLRRSRKKPPKTAKNSPQCFQNLQILIPNIYFVVMWLFKLCCSLHSYPKLGRISFWKNENVASVCYNISREREYDMYMKAKKKPKEIEIFQRKLLLAASFQPRRPLPHLSQSTDIQIIMLFSFFHPIPVYPWQRMLKAI